jgi:hypothetical protein
VTEDTGFRLGQPRSQETTKSGHFVSVNGQPTQVISVSGVPRLYTLYRAGSVTTGTLLLRASPGVQAYDFTFG